MYVRSRVKFTLQWNKRRLVKQKMFTNVKSWLIHNSWLFPFVVVSIPTLKHLLWLSIYRAMDALGKFGAHSWSLSGLRRSLFVLSKLSACTHNSIDTHANYKPVLKYKEENCFILICFKWNSNYHLALNGILTNVEGCFSVAGQNVNLAIGSYVNVLHRDKKHAGSLKSTKDA